MRQARRLPRSRSLATYNVGSIQDSLDLVLALGLTKFPLSVRIDTMLLHSSFFRLQARQTGLAVTLLTLLGIAAGAHAQLRYVGSDTVEPVIAAAEVAYQRGHKDYKVAMHPAGTSPGLRELCSGRAALVGASRPIKPDEMQTCTAAGIQATEIPVALDAVALVVSTKNTWLTDLKLAEVNTLFSPAASGKILSWKQVRPAFPDLPIRAAGVGIKHGTFSFFSESVGLKGFIRSDFKDFPDHMGTARYVAADAGAIGFIPVGNAAAMEGQVRIIGIDFGAGVVTPKQDVIQSGKYDRLARTVYLYVNSAMLSKAGSQDIEFMRFLIRDLEKFVSFANLIPLRSLQYQENIKRVSMSR